MIRKIKIRKSPVSFFYVLLLMLVMSSMISSCESEVNLMAPYKSTPVIVGILEYTADTQFVRINRTYLGAKNNDLYAQIKDSVEYAPGEVDARLYKLKDGNIIDSIQLHYITKPSRDVGAFFNQDVGFYYTAEPLFTPDEIEDIELGSYLGKNILYEYLLKVTARGETYTAITNFPEMSVMTITNPPNTITPNRLDFYREVSSTYNNVSFSFVTGNNTYRYLGVFRLNFDYFLADGTEVKNQYIDFKLGTLDNLNGKSGQPNSTKLNGGNWLEFLGYKLKEIPGITQVRIHNVEYRLTGANQSMTKFLKIAKPISDFTPAMSSYSNFDNGAIGVLGSRTVLTRSSQLSESTLKILNHGDLTAQPGLSFCVVDWAGSNYVCNP